ncbi:MAG: glycosyltransferase [Verrucomicrobiae bacterium]|nr:glycosyltransferase [Verrucomicrobiae bacterium]
MLNIVERLDRRRLAPGVCVSRKGGELDRVVEELGLPFIEAEFTVPARPYLSLAWRAWRAARRLRRGGFQIWHSFHYSSDYTEAIIARMAGARAWVFTKKNMSWGERAWRLRTQFATRIAAQNTDMLREFFGRPAWARKTRLVPRGVVTERFHPEAVPELNLRCRLGIPVDDVVVACVAQLLPVKGHATLLEAVATSADLHVLLAGAPLDAEYARELDALTRRLRLERRVHFLGQVSNVPALLSEVDVFVLPTWARWRMEGCPVALLEAMACGKACVATDIPGSRDLVETGVSGLLVPPEDVEAMKGALAALVADAGLRQQLGMEARRRVLERFTIEAEVAAHEALYGEIVTWSRGREGMGRE